MGDFREALAREETVNVCSGLGLSCEQLGDREAAFLVAYERQLELDPQSAEALRSAAWSLYDPERYDEAALAFLRALKLEETAEEYGGFGDTHTSVWAMMNKPWTLSSGSQNSISKGQLPLPPSLGCRIY